MLKVLSRKAIAMSDKAQRTEIQIGPHTVEGFMLPDGSYRMSLSQAAECVGKPARGTFDFLKSKTLKRLLAEGGGTFDFLDNEAIAAVSSDEYTADQFLVDFETGSAQGQTRIRGIPLEIVSLYWQWEAYRGNKQAFLLVTSMITETLERRFDTAFGVSRSEDERNQRLSNRLSDRDLEALGMVLAEDDFLRKENAELRRLLADNGLDPYALPTHDEA